MSTQPTTAENLVAGSLAGTASVIVCHPIDVIRTKLQTSTSAKTVSACYKGIISRHGYSGLYRGFWGPFAAQGAYKSVLFSVNSLSSKYIFHGTSTALTTFLSGAIAGFVNGFLVAPVELIRTRQITQRHHNASSSSSPRGAAPSSNSNHHGRSFLLCLRDEVREGGSFGLWRSVLPAIVRDGPGVGIYLLTFDVSKKFLAKHGEIIIPAPRNHGRSNSSDNSNSSNESRTYDHAAGGGGGQQQHQQPKLWTKLFAGSLAGIAFWVYALPVDTMKTLIENSPSVETGPKAIFRLAGRILREGGIFRLFRAWPVAFGRGIPSAAVTLTTFDVAADYFVQRRINAVVPY